MSFYHIVDMDTVMNRTSILSLVTLNWKSSEVCWTWSNLIVFSVMNTYLEEIKYITYVSVYFPCRK